VFAAKRAVLAAILILGASRLAQADVKLNNVFGDHMVLQQQT